MDDRQLQGVGDLPSPAPGSPPRPDLPASASAKPPPLQDPPPGPFAFPPPGPTPLALSRLPAGRHGLPPEFIAENHRNRLMAGAIDVLGERGYLASTVAGICKAAAVSPKTFYAQFDDKESCFLAAYDVTIAWLEEQGRAAAQAAESWTSAVKAATATTLGLLAADPRLARLCTVEIFLAGPAAAARHRALVDRLSEPLRGGREQKPPTGQALLANLEPTLIGGAFALIARYLEAKDGESLSELAPEIVEFLLIPYLGAAAARRVALDPS